MRGEAARKVFYGDKNLSFNEGYQLFMGGVRMCAYFLASGNIMLFSDTAIRGHQSRNDER